MKQLFMNIKIAPLYKAVLIFLIILNEKGQLFLRTAGVVVVSGRLSGDLFE